MTKKWASVHPKNRIYKIQFGNLFPFSIDSFTLLNYTINISKLLDFTKYLRHIAYELL